MQARGRERETQREMADTVRDTEIDTGSDSDEVEGETKENGGKPTIQKSVAQSRRVPT